MEISAIDVGSGSREEKPLLLCFSHLRWGFVFQRPQHLMSRFTDSYDVIYWEEPKYKSGISPILDLRQCPRTGVTIATPNLPDNLNEI